MKKVNHSELNKLIQEYYKKKIALLVYGTFGIGKSYLIRDTAEEIAKSKSKIFIEWNKINDDEKQKVSEYPEKYFVLMDIRLSEYDSSDIKGLPDFKDKDSIEWKVPFWCRFLEKPNSDGILFFDEMNLATPLVISSCYKIIYDRVINNGKIADEWFIMGCGNLSEDRAYTHDLSPPVRDRGGEVELSFSSDEWLDWAIQNNIDSKIMGFVSFKPSVLHIVDYEDKQKFTTPRGWERLNTLIKDVKDLKTMELLSSTAIGEGTSKEFMAFCKIQEQIDLEKVIKNPQKLADITEISVKYFVITAIVDRYKDNKVKFELINQATEVLDKNNNAEFVSLLWRLCFKYNPSKFKKDFIAGKVSQKIKDKYIKYLE